MALHSEALAAGKRLQVVVVSCDKSEAAMMAYQAHFPEAWTAVPYGSSYREGLLRTFKVDSVPRVLVFAPTGQLLCENAAATPLSLSALEYWERTAATLAAPKAPRELTQAAAGSDAK